MRTLPMLLLIAACGPTPPADGDDTGDQTTVVASDTGAPANPTTTTSEPETTDTGVTPTSGEQTTGGPGVPLQVFPVQELVPGMSGLDGIKRWQPADNASCGDGSEPSCAQLPELGPPRLLIDGVLGDATTAPLGARVAVLFPFQSCTLGCGSYDLNLSTMTGKTQATGVLPPALPCATPDENVWLAVDLGVLVEPGAYMNSLIVIDACESASNQRSLDFTPP